MRRIDMLGIRQKLSLGFGGLLAIIVTLGLMSVTLLTHLGNSVDVILRENYRSVIACQEMKEALERMDSGILFALLGYEKEGYELILKNEAAFERAQNVQLSNITVPGEREKTTRLEELFGKYKSALAAIKNPSWPHEARRETYFTQVLPLFQEIKTTADEILQMNQKNMSDANDQARRTAGTARRQMITLLIIGAAVAGGFVFFTRKWILQPVDRLITSAREIEAGNLDLVVPANSKDEIGALSEAFNSMAASLRELRRTDRARLLRIQQSTEQAFRFLPEAIAVVDAKGNIEVASARASDIFGLNPLQKITSAPFQRIADLFYEAIRTARVAEPENGQALIQRFIKDEEHYFRPRAVPILDADRQPTGVIIILYDATQERHQNELKKGVISTVAHQLRTPLTSVRMALHLLLEEKIGALNEKQAELAIAAREESDRLYSILEQLLSMSLIESGKQKIDQRVISSHQLVCESIEPFRSAAHDRGISLEVNLPEDLPSVRVDSLLIGQVFANLLSNALKYTNPGGGVLISAELTDDTVVFSVSDTGRGIPSQYLQKILEQFFRVPGQGGETGVGLGLSIVQEIVTAHGGTVTVQSIEGQGSTFTFSLPRADITPREEQTK